MFACWRAAISGGFMWFCVASGNVFILAVGIALAGLLGWDTIKVVSR